MRISDWSSDVCSSDLLGVAHRGAVPFAVAHLPAIACRELDRLDGDRIVDAETAGDLGRGDDRAGCAVRHAAAIEQAKRLGAHRRLPDRFYPHRLAPLRLGVQRALGVPLPAELPHHPITVPPRPPTD